MPSTWPKPTRPTGPSEPKTSMSRSRTQCWLATDRHYSTSLLVPAMDLVYLLEVARHPRLGREVREGMEPLAAQYPTEYGRWRRHLANVIRDQVILPEMGDQLQAASRILGTESEVVRAITTHLRRLLGETPDSVT